MARGNTLLCSTAHNVEKLHESKKKYDKICDELKCILIIVF